MPFVTGESKVITIGSIPDIGGKNVLEMILRESGRFIIRDEDDSFIALSEKKTRTITVSGTIGATSSAEHFSQYDDNPVNVQYESGDVFPQDLLIEYPVDAMDIYGIASILDLTLSGEPSDAVARLKGGHFKYWLSRQPMTSWNPEDCVGLLFSAYQSIPSNGMGTNLEGVVVGTVKKLRIPVFTPIKSSFEISKLKEILYLYSSSDILGYCAASTLGGSITGAAVLDCRLIVGQGYLPEEVEELLSPSQ